MDLNYYVYIIGKRVKMKRKYLDRSDWSRILKKSFKLAYVCNEELQGYVSAVYVNKVKAPLIKNMLGEDYNIVDDGYIWLQCTPIAGNHSMTVMYDKNKEIVQWYFDITKQNSVDEEGRTFFDDLYLDVVVLPSSEVILLDEDELQEALDTNDITKEDYELAYREANMLMDGIASDIEKLIEFSNRYLHYINSI